MLVEGHADPLLLSPDDVTGNVRSIGLDDKVETLGDVVGIRNIQRRPRNGNVADYGVNRCQRTQSLQTSIQVCEGSRVFP